ncbi:MAG: hypothetical protein DMG30_12215 [Acidobacteria bacterium]|nr:MAG: hypothetical protein DMG30_12215 [Acidobacteriota bacterium]
MYCPLCGAEYRPGFTICSDCQVDLVPDPPRNPSANPPIDDKADDTSFVLVWSGSDALKHAEICEALDRQKIPARTLGSEDHLFNLTTRPAFEVYVPVELVNSAREALHQAVPTEEDSEPLSDSEQLLDSGILEISVEEGPPDENDNQNDDAERGDLNLGPEDATVEIWSGQDFDTAAMIASSLRENHIPCRSDSETTESQDKSDETSSTRILVFPEDEKRGKEIVREIVDAVPPE